MRPIGVKCPHCNHNLVDISGLGESRKPICNNPACPGHFQHVNCRKCGGKVEKVSVLGIGHQILTCENGHSWDSLA